VFTGIPTLRNSCTNGIPLALASIITVSGSQYSYKRNASCFNSGKSKRSFIQSINIKCASSPAYNSSPIFPSGYQTPHVVIAVKSALSDFKNAVS